MRTVFPEAELYLCEWHLRHALEHLMAKIRQRDEHRAAIEALLSRVEAAFAGPSFSQPSVREASAADIPRLSNWLEGAGRVIEDQFRRRGLRHLRSADTPLSASRLDGLIEPIRAALHPRRYGLKNRERTNRLLLLMQLHANRQGDMPAYAKDIQCGWKPTMAAPALHPGPSPTDAATPRCAEPSQNAPWEGGFLA